MRNVKLFCLFAVLGMLLTGCVGAEKEKTSSKLTIKPYNLSEKESFLISKTDVGWIEFFMLTGTLKVEDDLQFSVEVYENGEFKEELLTTSKGPEATFNDSIISFAISNTMDKNHPIKLIAGVPSGHVTTNYSNNAMTVSSFNKLIGEKVTLEKNKPVYLAAWLGTTKNELRSVGNENGELPMGMEETELAFLYKVVWTDHD
ncbi:hypothetical protein [Bacillus sp. FJAT-50079]|uniref:hypothetical protein n=1 Tax=Bacillus sp. FJAT-50079 TaxID=2833577 RepID=UPI001BC9DA58|nr:hypothetical protein [Bacillus sp. FJAT-50079]MBS4207378.1 hypothetical protein [Bacillus sp. FJAT-50079]